MSKNQVYLSKAVDTLVVPMAGMDVNSVGKPGKKGTYVGLIEAIPPSVSLNGVDNSIPDGHAAVRFKGVAKFSVVSADGAHGVGDKVYFVGTTDGISTLSLTATSNTLFGRLYEEGVVTANGTYVVMVEMLGFTG